jgi:folate-dependent phosphoribosylglycinamide formyltransferase PurN
MGTNGDRIVFLGQDGSTTRIVCNAVRRAFPTTHVVLEDPVPRIQLWRRRAARLGIATVFGQALFRLLVVPVLNRGGKRRIDEIKQRYGLDDSPITDGAIRVASVNSDELRQLLQELEPRVVVVTGTRIIGRDTLRSTTAPFINIHTGITPAYRGNHCGYWAVAQGEPDQVGTTIHFIDEGIDTGQVLDQVTCEIDATDSFVTYPYLQLAHGLPLLLSAIRGSLAGTLEGRQAGPASSSKLWYHPTLWGYLVRRTKGVK